MSKFKINQSVVRKSDGKVGVVKAREVNSVGEKTEVKYLVDFNEGIENWKVVTRNDIMSFIQEDKKSPYIIKRYMVGDGKILTMAAKVDVEKDYEYTLLMDDVYKKKTKTLTIGFSLYNGIDEYDEEVGRKYAIHRCKTNPFTTMVSSFSGEFNKETVEAIMAVKANYIISNIDNFYRPQ